MKEAVCYWNWLDWIDFELTFCVGWSAVEVAFRWGRPATWVSVWAVRPPTCHRAANAGPWAVPTGRETFHAKRIDRRRWSGPIPSDSRSNRTKIGRNRWNASGRNNSARPTCHGWSRSSSRRPRPLWPIGCCESIEGESPATWSTHLHPSDRSARCRPVDWSWWPPSGTFKKEKMKSRDLHKATNQRERDR